MIYVKNMSNLQLIRIGTRKSPLALAQAEQVAERLRMAWPGTQTELVTYTTSGDKFLDQPLSEIGGKGLFTKEIEDALLAGEIHMAVHSMKDMPTVLPPGLVIGALLEREDPRDMLIGPGITSLNDLPMGSSVGTSSLRRTALLKIRRPDINIVPLRGNVQTRLAKLESGEMQATLLARAGLNRLGLKDIEGAVLSPDEFLPAIAQGAIGIECREGDGEVRAMIAALAHLLTELAVDCERAFLKVMDGSCRTPIAGYASIDKGKLTFKGMIARPDGFHWQEVEASGMAVEAISIGEDAGQRLLAQAGPNFLD